MEVKYNRKMDLSYIKRLSTSKAEPVNYVSDDSTRVPRNKKASTGVLPDRKQHGKNTPKRHSAQRYCVLCKKAGITERKRKSHSSENCFGKRSYQQSIKEVLGGYPWKQGRFRQSL